MSQLARRPVLCTFLYPSRCILQTRSFTQAAPRLAQARSAMPKMREPPQKSMRVVQKEAAKGDLLPSDLGLLPGTLIMPTGANKPSFLQLPKERLKLEWHRIKTRITDLGGVTYYKYGVVTKPNPRPKLAVRNTGRVASALHTQMYTAFADGDVPTLQKTCTDGLFASFRSRISARPPDERLRWTLHKHILRPKVVSHRAAMIPGAKGAALRQAVVRLRTRQSLARIRPDGQVVEGTGVEKVVQEYVVVQRRMWREKEEPWMVWGTVEESDWKQLVY